MLNTKQSCAVLSEKKKKVFLGIRKTQKRNGWDGRKERC